MKTNTPSRTAGYMALFRALETKRPNSKRLFSDPYAKYFLNFRYRVALSAFPLFEYLFYRYIQRKIPGALASGIGRTAYIDHLVEKAVQQGIDQVIILGAGFDCRAHRLSCLQNIPVIEIDHPDTSEKKRSVLRIIPKMLHPNVRYLQTDFNQQTTAECLAAVNVDPSLRTILIWEGVTNYLQPESVARIFHFFSCFLPGSHFIFTYVNRDMLDHPESYFGASKLLSDLEKIQENWTFGFNPSELKNYLSAFHLNLLEDTDADTYRNRYLPERKLLLKGYEFYRVALAAIS